VTIDSEQQLDRIREQFTRTADVYARMRQTTDARSLDGLVSLLEPEPTDRGLDVACGPGFLTLALARCCAEATGFDATDAFLELARREAADREQHNVVFQHGDAEALPFGDGSFECVTCRAAFHHFPRPERVLAEMARVTAPGGRILIADLLGSEDPVAAGHHDRIERLCDPTHARSLPQSEFQALFEGAGLVAAREIESRLEYDLEEWIDHGAPEPATRREIVTLMEAGLDGDRADLEVRREAGRLRFRHRTAAFVLRHAPGA